MARVTNISTGPRGAYLKGALVWAEPGEEIEADDYSDEWFAKSGSKTAKEAAKADDAE